MSFRVKRLPTKNKYKEYQKKEQVISAALQVMLAEENKALEKEIAQLMAQESQRKSQQEVYAKVQESRPLPTNTPMGNIQVQPIEQEAEPEGGPEEGPEEIMVLQRKGETLPLGRPYIPDTPDSAPILSELEQQTLELDKLKHEVQLLQIQAEKAKLLKEKAIADQELTELHALEEREIQKQVVDNHQAKLRGMLKTPATVSSDAGITGTEHLDVVSTLEETQSQHLNELDQLKYDIEKAKLLSEKAAIDKQAEELAQQKEEELSLRKSAQRQIKLENLLYRPFSEIEDTADTDIVLEERAPLPLPTEAVLNDLISMATVEEIAEEPEEMEEMEITSIPLPVQPPAMSTLVSVPETMEVSVAEVVETEDEVEDEDETEAEVEEVEEVEELVEVPTVEAEIEEVRDMLPIGLTLEVVQEVEMSRESLPSHRPHIPEVEELLSKETIEDAVEEAPLPQDTVEIEEVREIREALPTFKPSVIEEVVEVEGEDMEDKTEKMEKISRDHLPAFKPSLDSTPVITAPVINTPEVQEVQSIHVSVSNPEDTLEVTEAEEVVSVEEVKEERSPLPLSTWRDGFLKVETPKLIPKVGTFHRKDRFAGGINSRGFSDKLKEISQVEKTEHKDSLYSVSSVDDFIARINASK